MNYVFQSKWQVLSIGGICSFTKPLRRHQMSKKTFLFIIGGAALVMLAGCAGVNTATDLPNPEGDIAGFWWGLWNGLTCWFAFFGSLFSDNISIYEVHNNGGWYDFGFVLGTGILFGGGVASS